MSEAQKFGKEEFEELLANDPEFAAGVAAMDRLAEEDPRIVEAVLHLIDDEETFSDPRVQESISQMEAGELIDITPVD